MPEKKAHVRLGQFASTAIAGNDILSSSLYVSGITISFAGVYAPIVFLVIALVLWLYKHVYTEVVEALPLNGGAYNCLLNATSKTLASIAGVMTILSYVATSVISAKTAAEYAHTVLVQLPVLAVTAGIILFFAGLVILGVKDSAKVAIGIFVFHLLTLTLFVILGLFNLFNGGLGFLASNLTQTWATFTQVGMESLTNTSVWYGAVKLLFLAFAVSLLGVSGFESSANFVEEQHRGVFRKTLRNMLIGVSIFNPLIALVVLHSMPIPQIILSKDFILADVAKILGGNAFQYMMVLDAFLVLAGAVLTSFVGASGLIYRMALDHCLPSSVLLPKLKSRNSQVTRIVLAFTALCLSILLMTGGDLLSLAGVYAISFLSVMTLFAIGNMILRLTRPDLKRTYQGPLMYVIFACLSTIFGIIGNILYNPKNVLYFVSYFIPAVIIVVMMIYRDYVLEALVKLTKRIPFIYKRIYPWYEHVTKPKILLFAHAPEKLYKALEYIRKNETTLNVIVVHCKKSVQPGEKPIHLPDFEHFIKIFKDAQVFPKHHIEFIFEPDLAFGPETVRKYANRFRISLNNVFVGSIHDSHEFAFDDLGGVRIIQ